MKILIGGRHPLHLNKKSARYLAILGLKDAIKFINLIYKEKDAYNYTYYIDRAVRGDRRVLAVYKLLKDHMSNTNLELVDIPDGIDWAINESEGGGEWVYEKHNRWWGDGNGETLKSYG
jgi:hypothetical protein